MGRQRIWLMTDKGAFFFFKANYLKTRKLGHPVMRTQRVVFYSGSSDTKQGGWQRGRFNNSDVRPVIGVIAERC